MDENPFEDYSRHNNSRQTWLFNAPPPKKIDTLKWVSFATSASVTPTVFWIFLVKRHRMRHPLNFKISMFFFT
jgi:hypothetical protein